MERFSFDDEYVRRLKERDPETSEHFSTYFGGLLLATLRRSLHSKEEIEDVRQTVLTRVLSKLSELKDSRKLGAFVYSFCNHVLEEWRRDAARFHTYDVEEFDVPDQTNFVEELITEESRADVRKILGRMHPTDAALLLAVFWGEDKDEICRRFGINRKNLRVRVHRAKKRFRSEFCRKRRKPW